MDYLQLPSTDQDRLHVSGPQQRLACLDVFRGLSIVGMIVVNDLGDRFPVVGHAAWDSVNAADFVMPCFLFIVGVAVALSYRIVPSKSQAVKKIVVRSIKLFLLGVFLQGGFLHRVGDLSFGVSLSSIRIMGVLQCISLSFLLVALCQVLVSKPAREGSPSGYFGLLSTSLLSWQASIFIGIVYLSCTFLLFVPDYEVKLPAHMDLRGGGNVLLSPVQQDNTTALVSCGVTGDLSPACNAAGYIDRSLLGMAHMLQTPPLRKLPECHPPSAAAASMSDPLSVPAWCHAPFETEGLLSSLGASLSAFSGLHCGHILTHFESHWARLSHSLAFGSLLLGSGWLLQFPFSKSISEYIPSAPDWMQLTYPGIPMNKSLSSVPFVLFTAGAAALTLSVLYILTEVLRVRFYSSPLEWAGKNPLLIYTLGASRVLEVALAGVYWKEPGNNLLLLLSKGVSFIFQDANAAAIASVAGKSLFWCLAAGVLGKLNCTWKF